MKTNKTLPTLLLFLFIINIASAITTYEETSTVSRIVGESPTEMIRQMQRGSIDLDHATYFGDARLQDFNTKKSILDEQFGNDKYTIPSGWITNDLDNKINNIQENELILLETKGKVDSLYAVSPYQSKWSDKEVTPTHVKDWQLSFETNNPLLLWDSPYAGSYLPKEDTFVSRLVRDSTIIAPTSFNSPQFTKSFLCQLLDEKTIGEVFKDARNFHYNGGSASSSDNLIGLVLQSYALYGNPLQIVDMDWSESDKEKIRKYCNNFLENLAPNIEFLEQIGNYSKFRKHLVFEIPSYTIDQIENFSIINAENAFQNQEYGELVLPLAVRTTHFPTNTLITNFSLDHVWDSVDISVNTLPSYELDFVNRTCYEENKSYEANFENAYAENSLDFIARISPIEITNCTQGTFRLYKKFNYSVDYIALSPILIKNIGVPILVPVSSIVNVSIELMPLTDMAVNGSLAIFDQNNNKLWEEETTTNITDYNASFIAPSEEGMYTYSVEFMQDNETLNYDEFSLFTTILGPMASIPVSLNESPVIEINFYSYSGKNFDLKARYYLAHGNNILNEGNFTKTIGKGNNLHTVSFSGLTKEDQSYTLTLELNYLGQDRTISYLLTTNNVPFIYAVTQPIYLENDKVIINYTALDYEGDDLTVTINDSRFTQTNNAFEWQTTAEDAGTYDVLVTANDGILTDSQVVSVTVNQGCVPNWIQEDNACIDNTKLISYVDTNNCNSIKDLPADNGTYVSCGPESVPVINILSPINNTVYNINSIDLNWTSDEDLEWCGYSLDGIDNNTDICPTNWCYQESATSATACGGLAGGTYTVEGEWDNSYSYAKVSNVYDGNWNSWGQAEGQVGGINCCEANIYVNYVKPSGALSTSLWRVKDWGFQTDFNIPQSCWDQSVLQFKIVSSHNPITSAWYCFDGSSWNGLRVDHNMPMVYEEAMLWEMGIVKVPKNITLTGLSEGIHNMIIYGRGTDAEIEQSDYVYFAVNMCIPNWVQENNSCLINDTNLISYIDTNNCNSNENLPADNETYESCNYCSFSIVNTTWSSWQDQTSCLANDTKLQNRSKIEYDENYSSCYVVTRLESDLWNNGINNTYWDYQYIACDYCTPSMANTTWSIWANITSCLVNNTVQQKRNLVQYDINGCGEVSNQTFYDYQFASCDYCTPSWQCSGYDDCQQNDLEYCNEASDKNSCYEQTNLDSDSYNGDYSEFESQQCDYCIPNWAEVNTSCMPDNTKIRWYNDTNKCYQLTNLKSDNNPPENRTYSCEYDSGEPPVINILSPVNNTVYDIASIDLNWTSNKDWDWCGYSLNEEKNNTELCPDGVGANITVTAIEGLNIIVIYGNDSKGKIGQSDYVYFRVNTSDCNDCGLTMQECSAISDGICPANCAAGSDADCCSNAGMCWRKGEGCYNTCI